MDSQESPHAAASLRQAEEGAAAVANLMVWAWKDINVVLVPIIGRGGVAALYNRSSHLTTKAFPWLTVVPAGNEASIDLDALHALLNLQAVATAAAGGEALLRNFRDLLATLIGIPLTERLLLPVWEKYLNAFPVQDPSP